MATPQSPVTILKLLKKARDGYQKSKPKPGSKPELRHKEIVKGLQRLREMARKKGTPDGVKLARPFASRKKILLKQLTEHRKKLNTPSERKDDPNQAQLPAYLKRLLKTTQAVLKLDFATMTAADEAVDLDRMEEGDPRELDALDNLSDAELRELEQSDDAVLPETTGEDEHDEAPHEAAPPGDGDHAAWATRWAAVSPGLTKLLKANPANAADLAHTAQAAQGQAAAGDHGAALETLTHLEQLMKDALHPPGGVGKVVGEKAASPAALAAWQAAREVVLAQLRDYGAAIVKEHDPEARDAIILFEAIKKNLTAAPTTRQSVLALERYLQTDDILPEAEAPNPFGVTVNIRAPLLAALAGLKQELVT
jgi:hypothetical protein